jgi:hypothetical protein
MYCNQLRPQTDMLFWCYGSPKIRIYEIWQIWPILRWSHLYQQLTFIESCHYVLCSIYWCKMYCINYFDLTDICLNWNNGRSAICSRSRVRDQKIMPRWKKIYIHVWISLIYFCMHAKVKNHTLLTMGVTATAHRRSFHQSFPINRMLAYFLSIVGWNLVEIWGYSILLCTIY